MYKNYLKTALQYIKRHKGFSFINMSGLALAIACSILVFIWVAHELNFDQFYKNKSTLCVAFFDNGSWTTPPALAKFLKTQYPEIVDASRFSNAGRIKVQYNEKVFMESGGLLVDPAFIDMFTLDFILGNSDKVFIHPFSVLISESFAKKYFGSDNPLGKTLVADGMDFKVEGVINDFPQNSHIEFDFILPFELLSQMGRDLNTWNSNWHRTYIQLKQHVSLSDLNDKVINVVRNHREQDQRAFLLRPITEIYLNRLDGGGRIIFVYTFSIIGFLILFIACINFVNLSTAQASARAREVGMRKTLGANRIDLIKQFYSESLIFIFIAWLIGLLIVTQVLPEFNSFTGKNFSISDFLTIPVLSGIIGILFVSGILAGSYPAYVLSSYKPILVLKGFHKTGNKGSQFRRVMVVFQFSLSIIMIFGSLVLYNQLDYIETMPLGFNKDNIITMRIDGKINNLDTFKNGLINHPNIEKVTTTNVPPFRWNTNAGQGDVHWEGQQNSQIRVVETTVDYDYAETFGMEIVEGRFLQRDRVSDVTDAWVVNQAAVEAMGMDEPIGKWLRLWNNKRKIVGVIKNFHFESLHSKIMPMALRISSSNPWACIKIKAKNIPGTLKHIEKIWNKFSPDYPFEFHFFDDQIKEQYKFDQRILILFNYFTFLAISISCLGLFGLSAFFLQDRTKEIGIRKILGASVSGIFLILSRDSIKWVILASLIALPLASIAVSEYLQLYAYHVSIGLFYYIVSAAIAFFIALVTVSYQVTKASLTNPINSLRYE